MTIKYVDAATINPRQVANTEFEDGARISTVLLGNEVLAFDSAMVELASFVGAHVLGADERVPAKPYETMVFPHAAEGRLNESYVERYATEEEARSGHARIVAAYADGTLAEEGRERAS